MAFAVVFVLELVCTQVFGGLAGDYIDCVGSDSMPTLSKSVHMGETFAYE